MDALRLFRRMMNTPEALRHPRPNTLQPHAANEKKIKDCKHVCRAINRYADYLPHSLKVTHKL